MFLIECIFFVRKYFLWMCTTQQVFMGTWRHLCQPVWALLINSICHFSPRCKSWTSLRHPSAVTLRKVHVVQAAKNHFRRTAFKKGAVLSDTGTSSFTSSVYFGVLLSACLSRFFYSLYKLNGQFRRSSLWPFNEMTVNRRFLLCSCSQTDLHEMICGTDSVQFYLYGAEIQQDTFM